MCRTTRGASEPSIRTSADSIGDDAGDGVGAGDDGGDAVQSIFGRYVE